MSPQNRQASEHSPSANEVLDEISLKVKVYCLDFNFSSLPCWIFLSFVFILFTFIYYTMYVM